MAEKSKTKVDKLTKVFNKLRAPDKTEINSTADHESRNTEGEVSILTEESYENSRVLSSGIQHPRVSPTDSNQTNLSVSLSTSLTATMSTNANTSTTSTTNIAATPISTSFKVLTIGSSIREFSGTDPGYSAREYPL